MTWSRDAIADAELTELLPSIENAEGVVVRCDDPAALSSSEFEYGSATVPDDGLDPARAKLSVFAERVHIEWARSIQQGPNGGAGTRPRVTVRSLLDRPRPFEVHALGEDGK